ncbi:hypothetical protein B0H13DRAFT_2267875 [Mycena leptocephala]|nr:hypothetical protein B0H13DRAFT_2267875 [Mycena leptocephala]
MNYTNTSFAPTSSPCSYAPAANRLLTMAPTRGDFSEARPSRRFPVHNLLVDPTAPTSCRTLLIPPAPVVPVPQTRAPTLWAAWTGGPLAPTSTSTFLTPTGSSGAATMAPAAAVASTVVTCASTAPADAVPREDDVQVGDSGRGRGRGRGRQAGAGQRRGAGDRPGLCIASSIIVLRPKTTRVTATTSLPPSHSPAPLLYTLLSPHSSRTRPPNRSILDAAVTQPASQRGTRMLLTPTGLPLVELRWTLHETKAEASGVCGASTAIALLAHATAAFLRAMGKREDDKPRDKGKGRNFASLPSSRAQGQALPPVFLAVPWWPQSDSSTGILLGLHEDVIMGLSTRWIGTKEDEGDGGG